MLHMAGRVYLVGLIATAVLAGGAGAQEPPRVRIGSRVRLTLEGAKSPVIGQLMDIGPDSLTIAGEKARDNRVVLQSNVRQIEVSLRQQTRGTRAILQGGVAGTLAAGALVLVVAGVMPSCDGAGGGSGWRWCHKLTPGNVAAAIGLGAAAGAYLGLSHAAKHPTDEWAVGRLAEGMSRPPPRPQPIFGLGTRGEHRVLLIGLNISR